MKAAGRLLFDLILNNGFWRHPLEFCALASGSKGNAAYIGSGAHGLLVDVGLSGREIERRIKAQNLDPSMVKGIVVSHEHRDHSFGVGVWARRYNVPVYLPDGCEEAMRRVHGDGVLNKVEVVNFAMGEVFTVGGLEVTPFPTSHDSCVSAGFRVSDGEKTVGFATDLGEICPTVTGALTGCDFLYIESNHDEEMLKRGPYPAFLKRRIASSVGHLSNRAGSELLDAVVNENLSAVVLGHLSEINNEPVLAFEAAQNVLEHHGAEEDILLLVARQGQPGRVVKI